VFEPLSPNEVNAVLLSVKVATIAVVGTLPLSVICAYALARWKFVGHSVLNGLVHLPLVLPPVVTGYFLLLLFGKNGPLGITLDYCCSIVLAFRWSGAALAAGIMAFPMMVRAIRLSIEAVDYQFEDAARTLGANSIQIFISITLPLSYPGILAGAVLGFAKALGEFGATITFVSNIPGETQTLPAAIYAYTQSPGGDIPALRLAGLAVLISIGAILFSEMLAKRVKRTREPMSRDLII